MAVEMHGAPEERRPARHPFFERLEREGLPHGVRAEDAARAVFGALFERISAGEARDFIAATGPAVREVLAPTLEGRKQDEALGRFGQEGLFRRVSERLGTDLDASRDITRRVFQVMHEHLPRKEIDDVSSQLPRELAHLFRGPPR